MSEEKIMPGYMTYREAALIFSLMPDEEAAKAIKATVRYYLRGEVPELSGSAAEVFDIMRSSIDRGQEVYKARVEGGRRGGIAHWQKANG
jgi:hypothetical protein